jgi:hypothetical protein
MELFRPDKPICSINEDKFQRYDFAKRIAEIVSTGSYPESLVVSIYGKWGEGKSSVLNFIKNEILDSAFIINFNPWLFSDEKQLIKAFFEAIAISVGKKLKDGKQRAAEFFIDYADSISSISELIVPLSSSAVKAGKKLAEKFKKDSIEDLKEKVDKLIIEANTNFVVFIDDIDRLDITEVQAIFKLVKLGGDFPRTAYVLAFDDDKVAEALGPKYAQRNKTSGYEFLEKIIQVPLQLPKANTATLRNYTLELLDNAVKCTQVTLSKREIEGFINNFDKAFLPALNNPRLGVRFANSIGFSIPLVNGEVHLGDLMTIEGIKTFYPELYHFIRNNPHSFLNNYSTIAQRHTGPLAKKGDKEKAKSKIETILEPYFEQKESIIQMLIDLFPQLRSIYESYHYPTETYQRWYREMRICSPHHFERYFSYVVRNGDISDVYFKGLLATIETDSIEDSERIFSDELKTLNPEIFLFKLDQHIPSLSAEISSKLAKILASLGTCFPVTFMHLFFSPRTQATFTIKKLLERTNKENRLGPCSFILKNAKPLNFALEIFNTINDNGENSSEVFISQKDFIVLSKDLADRLNTEINELNIWDLFFDYQIREALELISKFYINNAQERLIQQLRLDNLNSLKIVRMFSPTIMEVNDSKSYKGEFTQESYNEMKSLIDPQLVYDATISTFGNLNFDSDKNEKPDRFSDNNLIALFQQIHIENLKLKS